MNEGRISFLKAKIGRREDGKCGCHRNIIVKCRIGVGGLKRRDLCIAIAAVRGYNNACSSVGDTVGQGLVTEPAEHGCIDDPQPLCGLGPVNLRHDARHIERNTVAGLQPERFECDRAFGRFEQ